MTVESANTIRDLDEYLPDTYDWIREGDDHIRMIKRILKSTFGLLDGSQWQGKDVTGDTELSGEDTGKIIVIKGAGITITLPRGADIPIGTMYILKAVDAPVSVVAQTGENIDGASSFIIPKGAWAIVAKIKTNVWTYALANYYEPSGSLKDLQPFGYDPLRDYAAGDVIYWNGSLYWALQASTSTNPHSPSDTAYWSRSQPASAGGVPAASAAEVAAGVVGGKYVAPNTVAAFIRYSTSDPGAGSALPPGHLFCVWE